MATAQRAFGELACGEVAPAARQAIGLAAARQAAGLPVPELARSWTYLLLCADRENQIDAALTAAGQLRAVGGSPDVPASVWARYPAVDAVANRELIELELDADQPGAVIWVDFQRVGTAPVHVTVAAGEHVIAAAAGGKRGWASGTAVRTQPSVRVALRDPTGPWSALAARVASWHGKRPSPSELAWVLERVHARIALVRLGDTLEAWGKGGLAEQPRRLGDDTAVAQLADVERVLGLVTDRVQRWDDHAPDPDRPLLLESTEPRGARKDTGDKATKWWVYAAIAGAAAVAGTIIYVHDSAHDQQRVELHYP